MSGILIFLFCFLFIVVSLTAFLLYKRNVQVDELVNVHIPQIEFTNKFNSLLRQNNILNTALPRSELVDELSSTFEQLSINLNTISSLYSGKFQKVNQLTLEFTNINDVVNRIEGNAELNTMLKLTAVDQLDTLNKILQQEIDAKTKEQSSLSQLISASGAYIYSGQANAYIDSMRVLNQLNKTQTLLASSLNEFEQLNMSVSVKHFEEMTKDIDLAMETWLSVLTTVKSDRDISDKIEAFKSLLNTEERVLGKWHSHLRLSEEVYSRVNVVNESLNDLNAENVINSTLDTSHAVIPGIIAKTAAKFDITLTPEHYNYLLGGLLLLGLALISLILIRVQFRLRRYGINTVKLCQSLLADIDNKTEQGNYVQSSEHLRIVGLIQQVKKPEHSESQYQALVKMQEDKTMFLANNHRLIHWRYVPGQEYIANNENAKELCRVNDINVVNWRQLFSKSSIKDVLSVAKTARDSHGTLSCPVKTNNDIRMDLLIDFDGKAWSGTLYRNDKVELLQGALNKAKNKLKSAESDVLEETTANTEKYSKMVLGAMLQSQGGSIDSVGASLQVYRQLSRVFDWCRQSQIVAQLQHSGKSTKTNNINFKEEIHAVLFNAMSEIYLQRNQIYLQTDRQLTTFAQIDQRLFHRMLLGVIRVSLAEFFNAKMLLNLKVVDLDNGTQTIKFTLDVTSSKPVKAIPDLVNRLVNEDRKVTASLDIIFYLRTLMYNLNINDIQTSLQDNGFKLFFEAQILVGSEVANQRELPLRGNLKQENIVLLSDCDYTEQVVSDAVTGLTGSIKTLSTVDALVSQYPQEVVEKRPINLIIVGEAAFKEQHEQLDEYVNSLSTSAQPKLLFMQPAQGSLLHKVGLYNQAATPLCQRSFQKQIVDLLESKNNDNRLIEPEILQEFHYLPTRVELLLAVSNPQEHQTLIRILQWLGMQVQVVSQPQAMVKQWQSGRYLVLISEFSQSPFMLVSTGRNVHRGVFTFKDQLFDTPEGIISTVIKNWKVSKLPNVLDIKALTSLLAPWLKSNTSVVAQKDTVKKSEPKVQKIQSLNDFLSESEVLNEEDKAYLSQSKIFLPEKSELPVDVVFDLSEYARNQGSSELASYMLDEYMADVEQAVTIIDESIKANDFAGALKPLTNVSKLSEVMAASDLKRTAGLFKESLDKSIANRSADTKLSETFGTFKHECQRLIAFSEAI